MYFNVFGVQINEIQIQIQFNSIHHNQSNESAQDSAGIFKILPFYI